MQTCQDPDSFAVLMVADNVWEKPANLSMRAHFFFLAHYEANRFFANFWSVANRRSGTSVSSWSRPRWRGLFALRNSHRADVAAPYAGVRSVLLAGVVRAL